MLDRGCFRCLDDPLSCPVAQYRCQLYRQSHAQVVAQDLGSCQQVYLLHCPDAARYCGMLVWPADWFPCSAGCLRSAVVLTCWSVVQLGPVGVEHLHCSVVPNLATGLGVVVPGQYWHSFEYVFVIFDLEMC